MSNHFLLSLRFPAVGRPGGIPVHLFSGYWSYSARDKVTILIKVLMERMCGAISPLPHVFMSWTLNTFRSSDLAYSLSARGRLFLNKKWEKLMNRGKETSPWLPVRQLWADVEPWEQKSAIDWMRGLHVLWCESGRVWVIGCRCYLSSSIRFTIWRYLILLWT